MNHPRLLSCKELAEALGRHVSYIYAMRARGFPMPGRRARLEEALAWLEANGNAPRGRRPGGPPAGSRPAPPPSIPGPGPSRPAPPAPPRGPAPGGSRPPAPPRPPVGPSGALVRVRLGRWLRSTA